MIPAPYNEWPVTMTVNMAAKLLGVHRNTLDKNTNLKTACMRPIGGKPRFIRDLLLRELSILPPMELKLIKQEGN